MVQWFSTVWHRAASDDKLNIAQSRLDDRYIPILQCMTWATLTPMYAERTLLCSTLK